MSALPGFFTPIRGQGEKVKYSSQHYDDRVQKLPSCQLQVKSFLKSAHLGMSSIHPYIICSPLVNTHTKRSNVGDQAALNNWTAPIHIDTGTSKSLFNIESTHQTFGSFQYDPIHFLPSPQMHGCGGIKQIFEGEEALARLDNVNQLVDEARIGIKTRKHFKPSQTYTKIWEDQNPPYSAAKLRHSEFKAKLNCRNHLPMKKLLLKCSSQRLMKKARDAKCTEDGANTVSCVTALNISTKNSSRRADNSTIVPTDLDVLFGRGPTIAGHNVKFRREVKRFAKTYRKTDRGGKYAISSKVVSSVKAYGGRFLALNKDTKRWYEVPDKRARTKVSQGEFICIDINNCSHKFAHVQTNHNVFFAL